MLAVQDYQLKLLYTRSCPIQPKNLKTSFFVDRLLMDFNFYFEKVIAYFFSHRQRYDDVLWH